MVPIREQLNAERQRAERERDRADQAEQRAERASRRVEELTTELANRAARTVPEPPRTRWQRFKAWRRWPP
jgi:dsDNA-specific endonuclease/ATPase MutS2